MNHAAPDPGRRRFLSTATLLGAAGIGTAGLAGFGVGTATASTETEADVSPQPNAADLGFLTDMTTHHVQALAMCQRVLGRDTGDAVQAAASEVLQNQAIEVGTMRAWLADWGASTAGSTDPMSWMGGEMGGHGALMPGMATDAEMMALSTAVGLDQGRMWLELMRAHHVGGVNMASAAVGLVATDKVRRLAEIQVKVQSFEIDQYDLLLATTYA